MGKMYYTEEEAAKRLGVDAGELAGYARDGKLRLFKDGAPPHRMEYPCG